MRRFRREGRYHYGSTGTERLSARRRTSNLALGRPLPQDEADNREPTESVSTDSGGTLEREDRQATEGQGN